MADEQMTMTLNDLMVGIEEMVGDKIDWQTSQGEFVLLDHENLTRIYDEMYKLWVYCWRGGQKPTLAITD